MVGALHGWPWSPPRFEEGLLLVLMSSLLAIEGVASFCLMRDVLHMTLFSKASLAKKSGFFAMERSLYPLEEFYSARILG